MQRWIPKSRVGLWLCLLALGMVIIFIARASEERSLAVVLDIQGAIGPATMDYVVRGMDDARRDGAQLIILRLDTPGGLDTSMRDIIKAILASPVPVATYVSPSGSRAASAGTYILYASHVAAMAPATTLGAATPVQMGGFPGMPGEQERPRRERSDEGESDEGESKDENEDANSAESASEEPAPASKRRGQTAMERKVLEDAVAFIRGLAERHGRNADWAEEAVREAVSLTASEALAKGVIDVRADNIDDLLQQIHGRKVNMNIGERILETDNLLVLEVKPDWRSRLLSVITNPNIAYILMLIGIYGIIFELANPGNIFPGVVGAISLVLALYSFQLLPINYAGLALIMLGIVFMIAEAFLPSFGMFGVGGILAFVTGSVILIDEPGISVSWPIIISSVLMSLLLSVWVFGKLIRLRHKKVVSGEEEMIGLIGTALEDFTSQGRVRMHSESWLARTDIPVRTGDSLRVVAVDGLVLIVKPVDQPTKNI